MKTFPYTSRFSVVCVPEQPQLFMLNMQVYEVLNTDPGSAPKEVPQAVVWCAVHRRFDLKKI